MHPECFRAAMPIRQCVASQLARTRVGERSTPRRKTLPSRVPLLAPTPLPNVPSSDFYCSTNQIRLLFQKNLALSSLGANGPFLR
jgi:hypothetical protein